MSLLQRTDAGYHAQGVKTPAAASSEGRAGHSGNAWVRSAHRSQSGSLCSIKIKDLKAQSAGMGSKSGVADATARGGNARQLAKSGHSCAEARV